MQFNLLPIILVLITALIMIIALVTFKSKIMKLSAGKNAGRMVGNILFIIGGLPLLIYPFVLLADFMQIAGFGAVKVKVDLLLICVLLFLFASISYPLTYIVCLILNFRKNNTKKIWPIIPLLHLVITVFLVFFGVF